MGLMLTLDSSVSHVLPYVAARTYLTLRCATIVINVHLLLQSHELKYYKCTIYADLKVFVFYEILFVKLYDFRTLWLQNSNTIPIKLRREHRSLVDPFTVPYATCNNGSQAHTSLCYKWSQAKKGWEPVPKRICWMGFEPFKNSQCFSFDRCSYWTFSHRCQSGINILAQ